MFQVIKKNGTKEVYFLGKKLFTLGKNSNSVLQKKLDSIQAYIKFTIQPSDLHPASGVLRDIQLGDLKILNEISRICKIHNLTYWIDYGTLLGAVRHKGFIPWDDDIDVSMMREDFEKFIDIFNTSTTDTNLQAELYSSSQGIYSIIKVVHKDIPNLFVDIFPIDLCYRQMNQKQKLDFSNKLKKIALQNPKIYKKSSNLAEFFSNLKEQRNKNIPDIQPNGINKPTVFYGIEFYHGGHEYNAFDYDVIFPLQEINFEGHSFPTVANIDSYLIDTYGDYMQLPSMLHIHTNMDKLKPSDIRKIKEYISK